MANNHGNAASCRMKRFIRQQALALKPSSIPRYHTDLGHFAAFLKQSLRQQKISVTTIRSLARQNLDAYLAHLAAKTLAPLTKKQRLLTVKRYLLWEADQDTLDEKILKALDSKRLPKIPQYLPRPISGETDRKIQGTLRSSAHPMAPMFLLLRLTGLRISELINLRPDCVADSGNGEKYLRVQLGKLNTERIIPLHDEASSLIDKIKNTGPVMIGRRHGKYRAGLRITKNENRLIGIKGPIRNVYTALKWEFEKITGNTQDNGRKITFHRLRHTYATNLLGAGLGITSIMKLLGHTKINMSLQYAKITPSLLRNDYLKAMKNIENNYRTEQEKHGRLSLVTPAGIAHTLISFVDKAGTLNPRQKKNLRLRLARLEEILAQIVFTEKMKLPSNVE